MTKTLAIETSCDDTSLAVVSEENGYFIVEKMLSYTQTKEHKQRGGVVPELAARAHAEQILIVLDELEVESEDIDFISVTSHPGLPGALIVGVTTAYTLGTLRQKPVLDINHIMGHVFSILVGRSRDLLQLPYVCLTVSGGHNDLYLVESGQLKMDNTQGKITKNLFESENTTDGLTHTKLHHIPIGGSVDIGPYTVTKLGQTIDDASGEVFDKVARMLGGPYPGGRWIGEMADKVKSEKQKAESNTDNQNMLMQDVEKNNTQSFGNVDILTIKQSLHVAKLTSQPYNFSFSGIKSQVYNLIERHGGAIEDEQGKAAIAFVFQEEVIDVLTKKLIRAVEDYGAQTIGVVGGVSANKRLREQIESDAVLGTKNTYFPEQFVYCTDNAAMIGVVGLLEYTAVS